MDLSNLRLRLLGTIKLINMEENVKKLIIIGVLVVVLILGAVGGTVLASSKPTAQPPVMVSDGDIAYFAPGEGTNQNLLTLAQPSTSGVVHVSLTVFIPAGSFHDPYDSVTAVIYFPDKKGETDLYHWIEFPEGLTTVEFDAGTLPDYPYAWNLKAYNCGPSSYYMSVSYNYTMTYPKP
jgi:hypothetical protein